MSTHVDRPTAVANTLAAVVTDTFEEGHPGADILKLENTARNRVKREVHNDNLRNLWLQRLYDGTAKRHDFRLLSSGSLLSRFA